MFDIIGLDASNEILSFLRGKDAANTILSTSYLYHELKPNLKLHKSEQECMDMVKFCNKVQDLTVEFGGERRIHYYGKKEQPSYLKSYCIFLREQKPYTVFGL